MHESSPSIWFMQVYSSWDKSVRPVREGNVRGQDWESIRGGTHEGTPIFECAVQLAMRVLNNGETCHSTTYRAAEHH